MGYMSGQVRRKMGGSTKRKKEKRSPVCYFIIYLRIEGRKQRDWNVFGVKEEGEEKKRGGKNKKEGGEKGCLMSSSAQGEKKKGTAIQLDNVMGKGEKGKKATFRKEKEEMGLYATYLIYPTIRREEGAKKREAGS